MSLGVQDAKERGFEWVSEEYERLLEDLDRDASYFNVIKIAKEQLEEEMERSAIQEQKLAEVDDMELPFDFDQDFGTSGVNEVVRQMIREDREKLFAEFDGQIADLREKHAEELRASEDRETQLKRQNDELQEKVSQLETENTGLHEAVNMISNDVAEKDIKIGELSAENHDLKLAKLDAEQKRDAAVRELEELRKEVERLNGVLRQAQLYGVRGVGTVEVKQSTKELYEQAVQATAEKRKVKIIADIGPFRKEIVDEHGNTDIIDNQRIESGEVEVVDEFPDIPEIEATVDTQPVGTQQDVDESSVALGGSEDVVTGDLDQEASAIPEIPTAETAQEEADQQEVAQAPLGMKLTETWEEWVTRTLNELQNAVYENQKAA